MEKVRTNIYLSADQMTRLGVLRKKSGLTMAEQVRRAIDFWLDSEEQKLIARYREAKAKAAAR
jgi:predicted DNA-binding protein